MMHMGRIGSTYAFGTRHGFPELLARSRGGGGPSKAEIQMLYLPSFVAKKFILMVSRGLPYSPDIQSVFPQSVVFYLEKY